MDLAGVNRQLVELHRGRSFIVAVDAAAAATGLVGILFDWGAERVMVVAGARGAGPLDERAELTLLESGGTTIMEGIREFFGALADPDDRLLAILHAFDPERRAAVIAAPFAPLVSLAGRPVLGARRPEWVALEDKMVADSLWEAAGVARAPSMIVPVSEAGEAARRLDGGDGTVWVADNTTGWHGGGEYTRWIAGVDQVEAALAWFAGRAERVRVMPFLDGLPCSIHGFVTSERVAAFRPVEMVILRRPGRAEFRYAGYNTFWDPPDADRRQMRRVARSVGQVLRNRVGYVGPFSVDGVMTVDGFRPTELNPRLSAGLLVQASVIEDLAIGPLTRALVDGVVEVDPEWLERLVVPAADRTRAGGMGLAVNGVRGVEAESEIVFDGSEVRSAAEGETPDATLSIGPTVSGLMIRMRGDSDRLPHGPSLAARAVAAARFAERTWNIEIGPLEAAPDLRPRPPISVATERG